MSHSVSCQESCSVSIDVLRDFVAGLSVTLVSASKITYYGEELPTIGLITRSFYCLMGCSNLPGNCDGKAFFHRSRTVNTISSSAVWSDEDPFIISPIYSYDTKLSIRLFWYATLGPDTKMGTAEISFAEIKERLGTDGDINIPLYVHGPDGHGAQIICKFRLIHFEDTAKIMTMIQEHDRVRTLTKMVKCLGCGVDDNHSDSDDDLGNIIDDEDDDDDYGTAIGPVRAVHAVPVASASETIYTAVATNTSRACHHNRVATHLAGNVAVTERQPADENMNAMIEDEANGDNSNSVANVNTSKITLFAKVILLSGLFTLALYSVVRRRR